MRLSRSLVSVWDVEVPFDTRVILPVQAFRAGGRGGCDPTGDDDVTVLASTAHSDAGGIVVREAEQARAWLAAGTAAFAATAAALGTRV